MSSEIDTRSIRPSNTGEPPSPLHPFRRRSASVRCDYPCKTATLAPATDLLANTNYLAAVTTGVKDLSGNALAQNHSWTFTTGST